MVGESPAFHDQLVIALSCVQCKSIEIICTSYTDL